MSRRKFNGGDNGEEVQDPKDYMKKVDNFILSEIQAKKGRFIGFYFL